MSIGASKSSLERNWRGHYHYPSSLSDRQRRAPGGSGSPSSSLARARPIWAGLWAPPPRRRTAAHPYQYRADASGHWFNRSSVPGRGLPRGGPQCRAGPPPTQPTPLRLRPLCGPVSLPLLKAGGGASLPARIVAPVVFLLVPLFQFVLDLDQVFQLSRRLPVAAG